MIKSDVLAITNSLIQPRKVFLGYLASSALLRLDRVDLASDQGQVVLVTSILLI